MYKPKTYPNASKNDKAFFVHLKCITTFFVLLNDNASQKFLGIAHEIKIYPRLK